MVVKFGSELNPPSELSLDEEWQALREATWEDSLQEANVCWRPAMVFVRGVDFPYDSPLQSVFSRAKIDALVQHGGTICAFGRHAFNTAFVLAMWLCRHLSSWATLGFLEITNDNRAVDIFAHYAGRSSRLEPLHHVAHGIVFPSLTTVKANTVTQAVNLIDAVGIPHLSEHSALCWLVSQGGDCAQNHISLPRISILGLPHAASPDDVHPPLLALLLADSPVAYFVLADNPISEWYLRTAERLRRWRWARFRDKSKEISELELKIARTTRVLEEQDKLLESLNNRLPHVSFPSPGLASNTSPRESIGGTNSRVSLWKNNPTCLYLPMVDFVILPLRVPGSALLPSRLHSRAQRDGHGAYGVTGMSECIQND